MMGSELRSDGVWWYPQLDMASYILHQVGEAGADWALSLESYDPKQINKNWDRYVGLRESLDHALKYGLGE